MKQIRRRLPQIGGNKLWGLLSRFCRLLRLKKIGRDRLARFLAEKRLKVFRRKSRQVKTTYSGHHYAVQPNRIKKRKPTKPNQILVADITYLPLENDSAYLFLVTDAFSRMIVGHHVSTSLSHEGAVIALKQALTVVGNPQGMIFHSDRGVQYCCHNFLDEIRKAKMLSSMTDADHCAQNALAECVNGMLKSEFLLDVTHPTFLNAERAVKDAVQTFNYFRPHGALKGRTPAEVHFRSDRTFELWLGEIALKCPYPQFLCVNAI